MHWIAWYFINAHKGTSRGYTRFPYKERLMELNPLILEAIVRPYPWNFTRQKYIPLLSTKIRVALYILDIISYEDAKTSFQITVNANNS